MPLSTRESSLWSEHGHVTRSHRSRPTFWYWCRVESSDGSDSCVDVELKPHIELEGITLRLPTADATLGKGGRPSLQYRKDSSATFKRWKNDDGVNEDSVRVSAVEVQNGKSIRSCHITVHQAYALPKPTRLVFSALHVMLIATEKLQSHFIWLNSLWYLNCSTRLEQRIRSGRIVVESLARKAVSQSPCHQVIHR